MKQNDVFNDYEEPNKNKKNKQEQLQDIKIEIAKANLELLNAKIKKMNNAIEKKKWNKTNDSTTIDFN